MHNEQATADRAINLYSLSYDEMASLLAEWGYSAYYASQLWSSLYREWLTTPGEMSALRPDLRQKLSISSNLNILREQQAIVSSDGFTRKYLLELPDGQSIETVLMKFRGRSTVCVSTQAGCAMGCVFCATGQMGFRRHLTAGEIVAQVLHVARHLKSEGDGLRNIVLMGMGEPLHNYEATMAAIDIMTDARGLAFGPRYITLSTVGIVPGIRRMADEGRSVRLAVSLHAATDAQRQALVPPARRWPLSELMEACRYYSEQLGRRVFYEWTLIEGQNDGLEQAHALGQLLAGQDAHVNLIPLNPTDGFDGRPTRTVVIEAFQATLRRYDLPSTVRQRRGIDVAAGCGQLATQV